jgi:Xaa-Pro aminopeptidase
MALPASEVLDARHGRLRQTLQARGLDALVVTTPGNIRYLANHTGSAGVLVVTADALHLVADFRYESAIASRQRSPDACPGLRQWAVPGSYDEAVLDCLLALGVQAVGFEAGHLTVARYDWWRKTVEARQGTVQFEPTVGVVEAARIVKDRWEQATMREAAGRLTRVAAAAFEAVGPGVAETAVAAAIEAALRDAGYERPAFDTIVASGPHAALPHHRAGDRRLVRGDLVVLDFGGVLDGYCCDLTRTVSVGPASSEAHRVYDAVRAAQQAALATVRAGVPAWDVDEAARGVLDQHGLGEAFGHGTGHGLGLDIHEDPRLSRRRPDGPVVPLEAGMVCTIEPGAYLRDWGGVRIEDDILVTEAGCEVLTSVPRDLLEIG